MKENIEQMFNDVVAKNFDAAKEQFSYIITQKVADQLEDMKASVGGSFMNKSDNVVTEGVGRMLGHPDSERGKSNAAILRKSVVGPGQTSIKSTQHFGGGKPPKISWESVATGRKHDTEEAANNDKD